MSGRLVRWLAVIAFTGCGGSDPSGPTPTTSVDVRDNSFAPGAISVASMATVTWTWRGNDSHNVVFEDGQGSSNLQTAGTHSRAFAAAGTFRYRCTTHSTSFTSGMVGRVIVQ
jgi:plastocyanin